MQRSWKQYVAIAVVLSFTLTALPVDVFAKGAPDAAPSRSAPAPATAPARPAAPSPSPKFSAPTPAPPVAAPPAQKWSAPAASPAAPSTPAAGTSPWSAPKGQEPQKSVAPAPVPQAGAQKPGVTKQENNPAAQAMKEQQSKKTFEESKARDAVASRGTTSNGYNVDPKDRKIQNLRSQLSYERRQNRDLREQVYYRSYAPVYYHDSFSPFFAGYFLAQLTAQDRAYWYYHHYDDMDPARRVYFMQQDPTLAARVAELERQNVQRDSSYVPPQMQKDPDVMYSKEYVQAVADAPGTPIQSSSSLTWLWVLLSLTLVGVGVYFFFIRRSVRV